jgi:hypothetical protein
MESVWNLPGPARPGYWQRLGHALIFLGVLGLGVILITLLTSLSAYVEQTAVVVAFTELLAAVAARKPPTLLDIYSRGMSSGRVPPVPGRAARAGWRCCRAAPCG